MRDIDLPDTDKGGEIGSLLLEIGRKTITTIVGLQAGPTAGAAVGVALAAAYLLYKKKRSLASKGLSGEYRDIVEIRVKIDELYRRREELSLALDHAKRPSQRRMIMASIESTDSMIRDLEDMLELYNTVLEAKTRITTVLGPKAAKEIDKLLSRIEKGEEPTESIYKLLAQVGDRIEKTATGISSLRLLLGGPQV